MKKSGSLHRLHRSRILVAGFVIASFCVSLFLQSAVFIAVHDALAYLQFFPSLWTFLLAGFSSVSIGFLVVLGLTVLFGRVYCSALCPLGITQDGIVWVARKLRRAPLAYHRPLKVLRYGVLAVTAVLLALGMMTAVNLLEPYSFFGRILHNLAGPAIAIPLSRLVSAGLQTLGIYVAPLSPNLEPAALVSTAVLFGLLVVLTIVRGRLYCNSLCPVGALLGLISRYSRMSVRIDHAKCTRCGRCEAVCPAECIDIGFQTVDQSRCVSCFRCLSACPVDAIRYQGRRCSIEWRATAGSFARRQGDDGHVSRRNFLGFIAKVGAGAGLFLIPALRSAAGTSVAGESSTIVPPGALSVRRFLSSCTACHLCVRKCPTRVLQPSLFSAGLRGVLQPRMDYHSGKCDYYCNICSQICPSGALLPLSLKEKQETRIGTSEFVLGRCVVYTNGTVCGACAESCPTGAVRMVPYRGALTIPALNTDLCIGCGSCEFVCPVVPQRAITVRSVQMHERVDLEGATRVEEDEPGEAEQGFAF